MVVEACKGKAEGKEVPAVQGILLKDIVGPWLLLFLPPHPLRAQELGSLHNHALLTMVFYLNTGSIAQPVKSWTGIIEIVTKRNLSFL